ncbi:MAG: AAA family ATPase, partial [Bacteroidetes bacterium]|nr:AAA family ATPase [Bacteroidota bacterium]
KYPDYVVSIKELFEIDIMKEQKALTGNYPKNIILYGPPGTGKTYNSIDKAVEIVMGKSFLHYESKTLFDNLRKEGQIEFVTFHQNYSYEDFMVGIKPDIDFEQLRFKTHKGIFYEICRRAKENYESNKTGQGKKKSFEEVFEKLIEPLDLGKEVEVKMKSGISYWITESSEKSISFRKQSGGTAHTLSINSLKDLVEGTKEIPSGLSPYYSPLIELIKNQSSTDEKAEPLKNFVLVIDEINRANISKVFGELITLLEDDKRLGEENELKITLPNGEKGFGVPPNLYLIGTMNTADKSIALIDIALRRRFEFMGYYPKYEGYELEAIDLLKKININIFEKKKSADYLIGHAYFMKRQTIETVLANKVIPLLMEYFSGKIEIVSSIFNGSAYEAKYDSTYHHWVIEKEFQPFLQFDGNQIRAKNFVGFIQNGEVIIEIYPKVFRELPDAFDKKGLMLQHIFYWFDYCRKWKFPFTKASLDSIEINEFPELIINLIASQFLETVSKHPLTMYQPLEEVMQTPKGTINFKRYINNSLSKGNLQNIECDYEPFLFDNKVNRIIKHCSRLLMNQTRFPENLRMLQEVVFILDEVEDFHCTQSDVDGISLNTFFEDYSALLDSCKMILSQQLYSNNTYDLSQWCLLFPMEYIFEDFLAGFLETHFSDDWDVHYQKSEMNLSNKPSAFQMRHDIFLTNRNTKKQIIIDTKYKIREDNFKSDIKRGVAQSDLYQMVSYAFKRGCTDVILVYPNLSEKLNSEDIFEIISDFEGKEKVTITALEIPFWSMENFSNLDNSLVKVIQQTLNKF